MAHRHDRRAGVPLGQIVHTRDHARLYIGERLAARRCTARIALPALVEGGVLSTARQNVGTTQALPGAHRTFRQTWVGYGGEAVRLGNRDGRLYRPCEWTRVDGCQYQRCEGVGQLLGLPPTAICEWVVAAAEIAEFWIR